MILSTSPICRQQPESQQPKSKYSRRIRRQKLGQRSRNAEITDARRDQTCTPKSAPGLTATQMRKTYPKQRSHSLRKEDSAINLLKEPSTTSTIWSLVSDIAIPWNHRENKHTLRIANASPNIDLNPSFISKCSKRPACVSSKKKKHTA
jgi:hypothetical protein